MKDYPYYYLIHNAMQEVCLQNIYKILMNYSLVLLYNININVASKQRERK